MSVVTAPSRPATLRGPRLDLSLTGAARYWYRNATVFRRTWLFGMIAWFAEPVIYLVAMGLGLGRYLSHIQGIKYVDFIAPGLLAVSTMFGATFSVTWDAWFKLERVGVYEAARATPLSVEDIALGEILWGTTRATIYGTAFAMVATVFGVFHTWWGLLVFPGIALTGFVFSVTGLIFTYLIKRADYLAYYWTAFITPMFMFAGVFFPLDRLPRWVRTIAWFMPLHHAADMIRALTLHADPARALGAALWLAVSACVLLPVPILILRRRLIR
jgi:lipooligosaccharide transport system permease protein